MLRPQQPMCKCSLTELKIQTRYISVTLISGPCVWKQSPLCLVQRHRVCLLLAVGLSSSLQLSCCSCCGQDRSRAGVSYEWVKIMT